MKLMYHIYQKGAYGDKHDVIDVPDPLEVTKYRMEQEGFNNNGLGFKSRVTDL